MDEDAKVYVISVAAQLAGMHPQTLRQYDRLGLVQPARTRGRGRRYSMRDIQVLREVQRLSQDEGVNLAGIKRILELEAEVRAARRQVEFLRTLVDPGRRVFRADPTGNVVADRLHPLAEAAPNRRTVRWAPRQLTRGPSRAD
ncbi:MAG: helix-turn-helix transcriptional regulator [Cellulomonas iranensis]|uniref:MerR family transcriptional regulator/heat shock protein HspR n=2 Tax=Actinomycetes TaxID=1760 RepID=A0ABU0GJ89_9CELL|nr:MULTISPECIES: helix-turn-helix transcriptional regulator [Cellulomonas]MBO9568659.1 helix-turn-helix transcriptional regulator [Cellulomonas iranensis]MDQ0424974.1 MerR family transcriptional regulator/heat shock protein HspR [Cellulomonas iranensis]TFH69878.1 MerR family transcriptional regulator [Cellulomonas sp. HD19AZ1]UCN14431.1 helix-turn-helix transcriptional regulator [Cellulomonas iranensis]